MPPKIPPASLLDETLESWAFARQGVIDEVRNLPANRFEFRPAPGARSVTELVQHIIQTGLMWSGELPRPEADFARDRFGALIRRHARHVSRVRSKAALIALLKRSHAEGARRIREAGEVGLLQRIRRFDGACWTRLSWMQHGIAHEEYHRGQLALCARLLGRVPALTKLIAGG